MTVILNDVSPEWKAGLLTNYLRSEAARGFAWRTADCGTFIADWVKARHGVDPCADRHRWRYRTARGAENHYSRWGGLALAVARRLRAVGLRLTWIPSVGDVAVILFMGKACCAIRTRSGWALRLDDGLATIPCNAARLVAAWSV